MKLTPLEISPSDDPEHVDSQHHHGLEFEYDCDAPECGIVVHVVVSPTHHLADKASGSSHSKVLVFETVTEGGFGKHLKLEEGATLELGRYEHRPRAQSPSVSEDKDELKGDSVAVSTTLPVVDSPTIPQDGVEITRKKRFTAFHFRKRTTQERSVAGPALAVVDAETKEDKEEDKDDGDNDGVKAMIRLTALDASGKPLPCANEQTTYLHIVRYGAPPPAPEQDTRPWVVKVVKREATVSRSFLGISHPQLFTTFGRLERTLSTCTRFMGCRARPPPRTTLLNCRPPTHPPPRLVRRSKRNLRPSACCVSQHPGRWFFCLAGTWSLAANVPST